MNARRVDNEFAADLEAMLLDPAFLELHKRAKHHLGPKSETLEAAAKHYRKQADDPNLPADERALWEQLATEAERRVNVAGAALDVELDLGISS